MTADRDADRITRAWLEQMPSVMPDRVLAGVLQAVETTPQVRSPLVRAIRRSPFMTRLTLLGGAAAAALVVVVGAATLLGGTRPAGGGPSASPTLAPTVPPTVAPTEPPSAVLPADLRGPWTAVAPVSATLPKSKTVSIVASPDGRTVRFTFGSTIVLASAVQSVGPEEISLRLLADESGCHAGDVGRYRWNRSPVGGSDISLALQPVGDDCAVRLGILQRPWVRAFDALDTIDTTGGQGHGFVGAVVDLPFLVTLPAGQYVVHGSSSFTAESTGLGRTFIAVADPWGLTQNCSPNPGPSRHVDPTIDAFSAYLASLPGFTVTSTPVTVAGATRAVRLVVPTVSTADCSKVWEWSESSNPFGDGWFIRQGDTDVIYLIERGGHLLLVQWLGSGVTQAEEMAVVSSISFDTGLTFP